MKLSQINYDYETPKEFKVVNPKNKDEFGFISLYSTESEPFINAQIQLHRDTIETIKNKGKSPTKKEVEKVLIKSLIAGYNGWESEDGKELEFNDENTELLLNNQFIIKFINKATADMGNFLGK